MAVFWGPGTFSAKESIKTLGSARWNGADKVWEVRGFRGTEAELGDLFPGIQVEASGDASANTSLVDELTSTLAEAASFSPERAPAEQNTHLIPTGATSSEASALEAGSPPGVPRGLSVAEFGARVRMALREAFPRTIYLYGVVSSVNQKGDRVFLDLAEAERADETLSCAVWRDARRVFEPLRKAGFELEKDLQIMLEVSVAFNKRGGRISLTVHRVVPEYTLAKAAALREQTNERLRQEGVFQQNKTKSLPFLPRRLAILTSSAGTVINDFRAALDTAQFGFELFWVDVAVQGVDAKRDLVESIRALSRNKEIDAILLFRGGGSAGDLSIFSDYDVARAICDCSLPVISAIGHEEDQSSAQDVSNIAFGVPKDIGAFFASIVFERRRSVTKLVQAIANNAMHILVLREQRLSDVSASSSALGAQFVRAQEHLLNRFALNLPSAAALRMAAVEEQLTRSMSGIPSLTERMYVQKRRDLRSLSALLRGGVERKQLRAETQLHSRASGILGYMGSIFDEARTSLSIWRDIAQGVRHLLSLKEKDLSTKEQLLAAVSPDVQLKRGFSIIRTRSKGSVVRSRGDLEVGEEIDIEFSEGRASAKVTA